MQTHQLTSISPQTCEQAPALFFRAGLAKSRGWASGVGRAGSLLGVFAVLLLAGCTVLGAEAIKPNIVFILADDLGINDLSCYGRKDQPTPNLDRLAAEGMRFTCAYAAQSVCSPTRASLLTGKTPARLHLTTFLPGRRDAVSQVLLHPKMEMRLPLAEVSIAERLKPAGYATGYFGKWHLGGAGFGPLEQGFDVAMEGQSSTKPTEEEGGKGEYGRTLAAERFMDEHRSEPFFVYVAHDSPHIALRAKPELIAKHAEAWNPTYAAMLETLDDCVGRLMAKVDALGLADRTVFIFTSDNGGLHVPELRDAPPTHNTPCRAGKGYIYEGGSRIPLIVRWPGKTKPGVLEPTPVITTDWVPTWLEMSGSAAADLTDGVSIVPLLTGAAPLAKRALYWHSPHYSNQGGRPAGSIREGDWKLIEHYEDGRTELFNLTADPGEETDFSGREPARAADLRGKLAAWRQAVGAQENEPNPAFDPALWQRLYQQTDSSRLAVLATAAETKAKVGSWPTEMENAVKVDAAQAASAREVIRLPASTAQVHGEKLRYEPQPEKNTLGYWVNPADWAEWKFTVQKPGTFNVQILQGCGKGSGGAEVDFAFDTQNVAVTVTETGHFQNFVPRTVGQITLGAGEHILTVRPKTKPGGAVMDLRQVMLLPALP